jgi:hypothetical protein
MKWLQGTWIRRYNRFRGRPFKDVIKPCSSPPVTRSHKSAIIFISIPFRARLSPPAEVGEYPWSSLPKFAGRNRLTWLAPRTVLLEAGDLPDTSSGWKRCFEYLEFLAADNLTRKELAAEHMIRGWCLGDSRFKADMKAAAVKAGADLERFEGLEPDRVRQERAEAWEERLQALARRIKIDVEALPPLKSHPAKAKLAAAMKASCSVSNAWLAQRLAMGKSASASQFARRWMLDSKRKAEVDALLPRVKT